MALFGSKKTNTDDKKPAASVKAEVKATETKKETTSMKDLYSETASTKSKGTGKTKELVHKHSASSRALVKPLITEKATHLAGENKYVFVIARGANKIEAAKAIQAVYGVKPVDVNIINMKGKKVTRGKIRGQRKDWKKAIVTLAKGDTIKVYEGV